MVPGTDKGDSSKAIIAVVVIPVIFLTILVVLIVLLIGSCYRKIKNKNYLQVNKNLWFMAYAQYVSHFHISTAVAHKPDNNIESDGTTKNNEDHFHHELRPIPLQGIKSTFAGTPNFVAKLKLTIELIDTHIYSIPPLVLNTIDSQVVSLAFCCIWFTFYQYSRHCDCTSQPLI